MPFPRKLLIENEQLVLELRPHWIALVMPAIVTILVIVGWFLAVSYGPDSGTGRDVAFWGATAIAIFVLIWFPARKFVAWATSYFVVTSDRIIHREGWIAKRSMEIPLEAINDVRFHQGVFERMIGAGDIIISSASEFGREVFGDIRNPEHVQKTIYQQGERNQDRMYRGVGGDSASAVPVPPATSGATTPAMPPASASTTGELERLAELRNKGVLTEDEFQSQKKKILGG
ncbi:MAG TPA: PH domain-containing protein [Actinomycetota bacterium]|nr:PH domain-containing protein [Actinomycetota bacterium]